MGKTKKERKHAGGAATRAAADPTGVAAIEHAIMQATSSSSSSVSSSSSSSASFSLNSEHQTQNQELINKLSGGSDVQKSVACSGIAHIIANQLRPVMSVLTKPLLRALVPLLLEKTSYDVAISAAGAIRNISTIGMADFAAHNAAGANATNPMLSLLLEVDACTIVIKMLEQDSTQWMMNIPVAAGSAAPQVGPQTPQDKRFHFLSQLISSLSHLSEQFDVVLSYITSNTLAMQHLLLLLLDPINQGTHTSYYGQALQADISALFLLGSESNQEWTNALARLPATYGGVAGIVTKILQRLTPTSPDASNSPQVRVNLAGILLNMMSPQSLAAFSSANSAQMVLPSAVGLVAGVGVEQISVTTILTTISNTLDMDPLQLGAELVTQLRNDRSGVDAQLHAIEQSRAAEDVKYRMEAEVRHQAKLAAKARGANGGMDDEEAEEESKEPHVDASSSAAPPVVSEVHHEEADVVFADDHDHMESTHKDASGSRNSAAASSAKKSPEVLIASAWSSHIEEKLSAYRSYLLAIKTAAELLTNICSSEETDEDISDTDSDNGAVLNPAQLGYIPKMILHLGVMTKIVNKCHLHLNPELIGGAQTQTAAATSAGDASMDDASSSTSIAAAPSIPPVVPNTPASLHSALSSIFPAEDVSLRIVELIDDIRNRCVNGLTNMILYLPKEVLSSSSAAGATASASDLSSLFTYACGLIMKLSSAYQSNHLVAIEEIANLSNLLFQIIRKDVKSVPINKDVIMMLVALGRNENVEMGVAAAASSSSSSSLSLTPTPSLTSIAASSASSYKRQVQLHIIGIFSLLGSRVDAFPYNFVIGSVLLDIVKSCGRVIESAKARGDASVLHIDPTSNETHLIECASESLNALIDLYSEDNQHVEQQKSLALTATLDAFLPLFQSALLILKQQKKPKLPRQLIQRLEENALNAKEFVAYKKKHL